MDEVVQQVRATLQQRFPDAAVEIEETVPELKVGGQVVSGGFDDLDQVDRQSAVWNALRASLPSGVISKIGMILTLTPAEIRSWSGLAAV